MLNKTTTKALHLLSRPLSVGAILLLLVNDHLLRIYWPSWWTGKIGDFAWLYFIPFALAAILACLIPSHWKRHEMIVFALSLLLIGGTFSLANTSPSFHLCLINFLEHLLGVPIGLRRDPTDLIALISLAAAGWMWTKEKHFQHKYRKSGLILLPMAALLTIANSVDWPDNKGIECLVLRDNRIYAYAAASDYDAPGAFYSLDGGVSWNSTSMDGQVDCIPADLQEISDPSCPDLRYRFKPPATIEFSIDGGLTWQEDYLIEPIKEVEAVIIRNTHTGIGPIVLTSRPLDALIEPSSGNLLLAMGHRGLLMREANGKWDWIPLGTYEFVENVRLEEVRFLVDAHVVLAISFLFLGISTAWARFRKTILLYILVAIFWGLWLFSIVISSPANNTPAGYGYSYNSLISWGCIYLTLGISLLLGLISSRELHRDHPQKLWRILIPASIGAVMFIIPFILWAYMIIPKFSTAAILGCTLPFYPLVVGDQWDRFIPKSEGEMEQPKQEEKEPSI
jgi:hypothetical protein